VGQIRADQHQVAVVRNVVPHESLADAVEHERQLELGVVVPVEGNDGSWPSYSVHDWPLATVICSNRGRMNKLCGSAQAKAVCLPQSCKKLRVPFYSHGSVATNLASLRDNRKAQRPCNDRRMARRLGWGLVGARMG
jgi:hypothetical protein